MKGLNSLTNIDWYLRHVELLQLSVVYADEVNKTFHRVAMSTNCDQWKPRCLSISRELKCLRKAFRSGSNSFENSNDYKRNFACCSKFRSNFCSNFRTWVRNIEIYKTMRLRTFVRKFAEIRFGKKVRSFLPKSSEMFLNSSKFVLISFAQYCKRWFILQKSCLQSLQRFRLVKSLQSDALSELVSSVTSKVSFSDKFAKRCAKRTRVFSHFKGFV